MSSSVDSARLAKFDTAFGRLRRLWESPVLRRRFMERMGTQIDPGVVRTLRAVREAGEELGVSEVAAWLGIDRSTASRLIESAVSAGYLDRVTSEIDRRRCVLTISELGQEVLDRALRIREELLSELTADWSDEDVEKLSDLVHRLAHRVADLENRS